jgi:hypothetical protein
VINYRFQGVAEKIPETQETVLVKLVKLRVRSIKCLGWIWLQGSQDSRGLGEKIARHKRYANHYRVLQGSKCKTVITSSPSSGQVAQAWRRLWWRCLPALGALRVRLRCGVERGEGGELGGVLTLVEDGGSSQIPQSTVAARARSAGRRRRRRLCAAGSEAASQQEARARAGAVGGALGLDLPFYGDARGAVPLRGGGGHGQAAVGLSPVAGWAPPGQAWAGAGGPGRCGSSPRARPR